MDTILKDIEKLQQTYAALAVAHPDRYRELMAHEDVALTYTSSAIEGVPLNVKMSKPLLRMAHPSLLPASMTMTKFAITTMRWLIFAFWLPVKGPKSSCREFVTAFMSKACINWMIELQKKFC